MQKTSKDLGFTIPQYWIVFLAFCVIAVFSEFISISMHPAEFHFAHWPIILRSFIKTLLDNFGPLGLTVVIYIHFISRKTWVYS